jgi:hypothetical protein
MSDLSNDTKKHTTKSRETIPLMKKTEGRTSRDTVSLIHVQYNFYIRFPNTVEVKKRENFTSFSRRASSNT